LLAGAVPIVDYDDKLSEMWAGLPVMQVRDWSTVTPASLEAAWDRLHGDSTVRWTKVYKPFWLHKLLNAHREG